MDTDDEALSGHADAAAARGARPSRYLDRYLAVAHSHPGRVSRRRIAARVHMYAGISACTTLGMTTRWMSWMTTITISGEKSIPPNTTGTCSRNQSKTGSVIEIGRAHAVTP